MPVLRTGTVRLELVDQLPPPDRAERRCHPDMVEDPVPVEQTEEK
jgi:hypothetical protein